MKTDRLCCEGYYSDIAPHMNTEAGNTGFKERCQIFRKESKEGNAYKSEGVRFFGKLQLDFLGCQTGLPPGTKVELEVKSNFSYP